MSAKAVVLAGGAVVTASIGVHSSSPEVPVVVTGSCSGSSSEDTSCSSEISSFSDSSSAVYGSSGGSTSNRGASGAQRAQVIVIPHSHHAGAFFAAHAAFQALYRPGIDSPYVLTHNMYYVANINTPHPHCNNTACASAGVCRVQSTHIANVGN